MYNTYVWADVKAVCKYLRRVNTVDRKKLLRQAH